MKTFFIAAKPTLFLRHDEERHSKGCRVKSSGSFAKRTFNLTMRFSEPLSFRPFIRNAFGEGRALEEKLNRKLPGQSRIGESWKTVEPGWKRKASPAWAAITRWIFTPFGRGIAPQFSDRTPRPRSASSLLVKILDARRITFGAGASVG
jgi:hypothetical protein